MQNKLEIRADDVLQGGYFTASQKNRMKQKELFHWFVEADEPFKKYNYPMILAVCADGLDLYPDWIDYIKEYQYRYIIELHGMNHRNPKHLTTEELLNELINARWLIERTFGDKINTWYVPFGRRGRHQDGEMICKALGLKQYIPNGKVDAKLWFKNKTMPHVNFHYWDAEQNEQVSKILSELCGKK